MSTFWTALKRGIAAAGKGDGKSSFTVEGKPVVCPHCKNREFAEGTAHLDMTFIGLGWADRSAHTLVCSRCGRIEWYLNTPQRIEEQ